MSKLLSKLLTLLVSAIVAGCANAPSSTPNYDAKFGDAVRQARSQMLLNPNAATSQDPMAGIDGRAAREAVILYQDTFKAPPPVVNVINIGGSR